MFKRARYIAGYSLRDLAVRVGVSPSTVERWENGTMLPSAKQIMLLAEALRMPPERLINGMMGYENF